MTTFEHHAAELRNTGAVVLPAYSVFSAEEIDRLDTLQSQLPEEKVTHGDAGDIHDVFCRRIQTDGPGEHPVKVNRPCSDEIMEILEDPRHRPKFDEVLGSTAPRYIRRCQVNRMIEGSFVGLHLDAAANPDYDFSVIVQFGRDFTGGHFVTHPEGEPSRVYEPPHGSVLITTCDVRHEVTTLTSNERCALVYFFSSNGGANRRCPSTLPSTHRA